jgi:hypothetical protein
MNNSKIKSAVAQLEHFMQQLKSVGQKISFQGLQMA